MAHSHIQRMQMLRMTGQPPQQMGGGGGTESLLSGSDNNSVLSGGAGPPVATGYGAYQPGYPPGSVLSAGSYNRGPGSAIGSRGPGSAFGGSRASLHSASGMMRSGSRGSMASGMGMVRTISRTSLGGGAVGTVKLSRSLGASHASLASVKSFKSTIQQEAHDRKVQSTLRAPWYGPGKKPFIGAILMLLLTLALLTAGLTVIIKRAFGQLHFTLDKEEMIGPALAASSILSFGLAMKFLNDAYKLGAKQRKKTKFQAANSRMVMTVVENKRPTDTTEKLMSGTASKQAITRTPMGSRCSLSNLAY